jgi:oxygen-dependent protoporphyrinogen oxidase
VNDRSLHSSVLDVVIVGGGIAGLAAAFDLQARGLSARVIEATSRPGGVIATERTDGWVIDGGPDSLLVQKPAAVALCRELGIADRLVSTLLRHGIRSARRAAARNLGRVVPSS